MISLRRIGAVCLRHLYTLKSGPVRLLEMAYWPTMQMILWGFISSFFTQHSSWLAQSAGALLAAMLLWDVLFRANLGVSVSFLEEMWARNLGHLFVSPLRPTEYLLALMTMSLLRTLIGIIPAAVLAIPFYSYNVFAMGLPLLVFFSCLMVTGWCLGIAICALILRFGLGAESLAWVVVFAFAPISGIYYPISVLPGWLQPLALAFPPAHVFEGMRAVLFDGAFLWGHLWAAVGLNLLYLAVAGGGFLLAFRGARRRGALLNHGE